MHKFAPLLLLLSAALLFVGCREDVVQPPLGDDDSFGDDDTSVGDDDSFGDDDTSVGDDDTSVGDDDSFGDDDTSVGDDDAVGDDDTVPDLCIDDSYEENDSEATAASIAPGFYPNMAACDGDTDFFSIYLSTGDQLEVSLLFPHSEGDIDLKILDSSGATLGSSTSIDDNEDAELSSAPATGVYLIKVTLFGDNGLSPGNSYDMHVLLNSGGGDDDDATQPSIEGNCADNVDNDADGTIDCADNDCAGAPNCAGGCATDGYENNDSAATATAIVPGAYAGLTACSGDEDFFSITLLPGDKLSVNVTFPHNQGDIDLQLQAANGSQLALSNSSNNNESVGPYTAPSQGTYIIRVWLQSDLGSIPGNSYSLSVTVVTTTPTNCTDDSYENNDSMPTASSLGTGSFSAAGLVACPGDDDWYSYYLASGEILNVTLTFSDASGNIDVQIFDSSGSPISGAFSNNDNETLNLAIPSTGTWNLRVFLNGGDDAIPGNTYGMSVGYTPAPSCNDDIYENNDTSGSATALPPATFTGTGLNACPGDEDWFRYYVAVGETLDVGVLFSDAAGDIEVELFNPSGAFHVGSYSSTNNEFLQLTIPTTGYWQIRVYLVSDDSYPGNNYDLNVSYVPVPSCPEDSYEDNDISVAATTVSGGGFPGTQLLNLRSCPGDDDWFRVFLFPGDTLVVNLWFNHAFGDIDIRLFAPGNSTSPVASGLTVSSNEGITQNINQMGYWQLRVSMAAFDDSVPGNSYDLDVWDF